MRQQNKNVRRMVTCAMIAAAYCAINLVMLPFAFGPVQVRVAEALTLLPVLSPIGIWGVTLGCALTNAIGFATGANIIGALDILFGTSATLIAAIMSYELRHFRIFGLAIPSSLPPVLVNAVIVGAELTWVMAGEFSVPIFLINAVQVGAGQALSCCVVGVILVRVLEQKGMDRRLFAKI